MAGIPPDCASARELLWPGATLDLGTVDRAQGTNRVRQAVAEWRPERARLNYLRALERLDWRWRFRQLAATMRAPAPRLDAELGRLADAITAATPGG